MSIYGQYERGVSSELNLLRQAFQDKEWHCGPETANTPVYFGNPKKLTDKQLDACRLYPRIQRGDFPYGMYATFLSPWNTVGMIQGRYDFSRDFSFKRSLLSPIVLRYPDDFPTPAEFREFTKKLDSALKAMRAHGGRQSEWMTIILDSSLDEITLSHHSFPTITFESALYHEQHHAEAAHKNGYHDAGFYYLGLDIVTKGGASTSLVDGGAYYSAPKNIAPEHLQTVTTSPLFPSADDWKLAFKINREKTLQDFIEKPWFPLVAEEYRENICHMEPQRVASIGGGINVQLLNPDIFGSTYIDGERLKEYRIDLPEPARNRGYFPPRNKWRKTST